MQNKTNQPNWIQYVTSVFALLLVVSLFAGWYAPDVSVNTDKVFVNTTVCDTVDVSSINDKLDQVQVTLDEDELWTTEAEFLAEDEWSDREYKDIYNALDDLLGNIDEREDINKVVIKDSNVVSFNVDNQDAIVEQEVKVYYEDLDGDDVKEYLIITTEIIDGEVEDQTIDLA